MTETKPLQFEYDEQRDIITIEGVKYAGDVFRTLGLGEIGTYYKLEERRGDGLIVIHRFDVEGLKSELNK